MPNTDGKCSSRLRITPSSSSSTSSSRYHPHLASTAARTLLLACIPATTTAALSFLLGTCYGCQSIASSATAVLPSRSLCRANGRICFVNGPTGFLPHRHCDVSGSRGVKRRLDGFLGDLVVSGGPTHSSTRRMTMGSTRFKRGASRVGGKPGKPRGVGKKVRRLLEPASEAERAYDAKKEKVATMNWGNLGKTAGAAEGRRGQGGGRGMARMGAAVTAVGLEAAWKDTTLPKEGDMLQCRHFKSCSGCVFDRGFDQTPIMVDSSSFLDNLHAAAARKRLGSAGAMDFEPHFIHGWDPHGWRTVAKLAARPISKWGGVELGLFKAGSHDVLGMPECRVHHPSINRAVKVLQASAKKIGVKGFRQENMDGDLRYIQVAVERTSGRVQLALVWNEENYRAATPKLQLFAKELRSSDPELFHSIWANFRVGGGNAIFSRDPYSWHRCSGPEYLKEVVGPAQIPFFFSPPLFRQANLDHFERIVEAVVDWVPEGSGVCELYAGVGVLGLNCASKASFVRCSDVNSFNPRSFDRSRSYLPMDVQNRVSFEALSAEDAIEEGEAEESQVLIVDPPRKGLDKGVLDALIDPEDTNTSELRRVIYVSCGFDALKRDTVALISAGWSLRHSEGFVLFPGSDHVETLAIFDR